jgi:succinoglycan biosynthesis transport protein ExoP
MSNASIPGNAPAQKRRTVLPFVKIKSPKDYINMYREWWPVGLIFGVVVGVSVGVYQFTKPPVFRTEASLLFVTSPDKVLNIQEVVDTSMKGAADLNNHIDRIRSQSFFEYVNNFITKEENEKLRRPYADKDDPSQMPSLGAVIFPNIEVYARRNTTIICIAVRHRDPEAAAIIANRYARKYIDFNLDQSATGTQSAIVFLQSQADDQRRKVEQAEKDLQDYRARYNLASLADNQNVILQRVRTVGSSLIDAELARISLDSQAEKVAKIRAAGGNLLDVDFIAGFGTIPSLQKQIDELRAERIVLEGKYLAKHPKMIANASALDTAQKQLQENIEKAVSELTERHNLSKEYEQRLRTELTEADRESLRLDKISVEYRFIENQANLAKSQYSKILDRLNETTISSQLDSVNIKLFDQAWVPGSPVEPNLRSATFQAAFLGIVCLLFVPVVIGTFDTRLKAAWEVEELLNQTLLGAIPSLSKIDAKERMHVVDIGVDEIASEAFRGLYGQMRLNSPVPHPKILLITSTVPAEGKSLIASNLAYTFAAHGRRVLLVDCDFRRPTLNNHFSHPSKMGILRYLEDESRTVGDPLSEPTLGITRVRESLYFLPSGGSTRKPTEFFDHPRFRFLMETLRSNFDLVIVDTPPVGVFPDSLLLCPISDEVVFVARFKRVWRNRANAFLDKLRTSGAVLAGVVMNDIPPGLHSAGYDYYGYGAGSAKEYQKYYAADKTG